MATSHYEIEFNVKGDGTVTAKVEGLMSQFRSLDTAINKVNQNIQANQKTLKGTVAYYDQQIDKISKLRDATANTSQAYKEQTAAIDKLKLAKAELTNSIKQVQMPMEGTLAAFRREIQVLRDEQQQVARNQATWQEYESRIAKVRSNIEQLTGSTRMSVKPNRDMISNAGLAGATITELGRTVSDANYGIRGMANNLSQLSTLFITLVAKTEGGVIPALTMLGKQIWGPLGLILGFQVLVQQLEAYAIRQDKAADSTKRASDEVYANAVILQDYVTKLNGVNLSEDERIEITQKLIKEIPVLKEEDFDYGNNLLNVRKIIDDYVISQASRLEIDQLISENSEILANKQRALNISNEKDLNKRAEAARRLLQDAGESTETLETRVLATGATVFESIEMSNEQVLAKFKEFTQTLNDETKPILDKINELRSQIKFDEDEGKEDAKKTSTIYQDLSDELAVIGKERFQAQRIQADQEFRDTIAKIKEEEKEKIISADQAEKNRVLAAELRAKRINEINKEENEYLLDLTEKEAEKRERDEQKMLSLKEKTSKEAASLIEKETTRRINAEKKVALENIKDKKLLQAEFNRIDQDNIRKQIEVVQATVAAGIIGAEVGAEVIEKLNSKLVALGLSAADPAEKEKDPQKRLEKTLRQVEEAFNFVTDAAMAALDAEMSIEEARTANLNNNLRLRLRNEKLTAEQREAINAQIAKNEDDLQQKRDKLAEKQFKLQKAISIGQALITTYEMASRAYNAVLAGPEKFLGVSALALAKVAAGAATLFGLAQVRAISRQQFVPSAISAPTGGGEVSAPAVQVPDFNVVGQSQVSQLAEVVQGQLNRPVKTYVVASDVSTAQELERKKISTATI